MVGTRRGSWKRGRAWVGKKKKKNPEEDEKCIEYRGKHRGKNGG